MRLGALTLSCVAMFGIIGSAVAIAQQPAQGGRGGGRPAPPPLVFEAEWQKVPGQKGHRPEVPDQAYIVQGNVVDPKLELKLYGAAKKVLNPGGGDASTVWSGEADAPLAVTFRHKDHFVDLTGLAKIRWITKTSGFHAVRPVLKLADGTMMVGDFASMNVPMLAMTEFPIATIRWIKLDPERVVTLNSPGNTANETWIQRPDLSKVDEVGYADLMPGSGHGAGGYIHVGAMEVYGRPVPRGGATN
jgi:hypothetical protein